jgi:uncharacterized protein YndB with AHSA1/START domain
MRLSQLCIAAALAVAATAAAGERKIVLRAVVDGPVEEVYRAWTTPEGTARFLAPRTVVGAAVGDEYVAIFDPQRDPEGLVTGTRGARIVALEPPHRVVFEWIPFIGIDIKRADAPPYAPPHIRDARPIPTRVEIVLEPQGKATLVTLSHDGFLEGDVWDRSFVYNRDRAWPMVLRRLEAMFAKSGARP